MAEQIVGDAVSDLLSGGEEVARLELLVAAAARLFDTLDLDEVLPEVLALARDTLAADAYSLWSRDTADDTWAVRASAGLSAEYVNAAAMAVQGNTARVSLEGPLVVADIASTDWLTDEHKAAHAAEGTSRAAAPAAVTLESKRRRVQCEFIIPSSTERRPRRALMSSAPA